MEVPLPCIDGEGQDRDKLIAEQLADVTFRNVLELAQRKEKGYSFDQGILVHYSEDSLGDSCQRVVVPLVRRNNVLELGHSNPLWLDILGTRRRKPESANTSFGRECG